QAGILLHDVGHGPYSHALEEVLVPGIHHEDLSLLIMEKMNQEMGGALTLCLAIFTNQYERKFLHQLISGQLDMDRLDYLSRDSFFSGVSEGVVYNDQLMVEEKAIYSVEKFLLARRQMYWQVYRHKTVLAAEKMLVRIVERAREIFSPQDPAMATGSALDFFLGQSHINMNEQALDAFARLDDVDLMAATKKWMQHPDPILGLLCKRLLNRKLYKVKIQHEPIDPAVLAAAQAKALVDWPMGEAALPYLVFTGEASNTTYQESEDSINILYKDGSVRDIMDTDQSLIGERLRTPVKKFYICSLTP
ncbi:MAG: phosphohydrolase, partial [Sphingobacteriia bacterium]